MDISDFIRLDLPPLITALCTAITCGLLGNFLVLRRMGLMGDAISHAVLPGIVIAFLLTSSRAVVPVFIGAAISAMACTVLIRALNRLGRIEIGASMAVVFSVFFALGVLLIEQAAARQVDLDADCLLHGQLETLFWLPPEPLTLASFLLLPRQVITALGVMVLIIVVLTALFKELVLVSFDLPFATAIGLRVRLIEFIFLIMLAGAVVASFEAVGSILVIGMLIGPAATARLYADSLKAQITVSILVAVASVLIGYAIATLGADLLGFSKALNIAGTIMATLGGIFMASAVFAPRYGMMHSRHWCLKRSTSPGQNGS